MNSYKIIKCDNCQEKFHINKDDIIVISSQIKYVECPICGMEIIL